MRMSASHHGKESLRGYQADTGHEFVTSESDDDDIYYEENVRGSLKKMSGAVFVLALAVVIIVFATISTTSQTTTVSTRQFRSSDAKYVRKEIRNMSDTELSNYFAAVWTMKDSGRQDGRGYLETYDDFVAQHMLATSNSTVNQAHEYAAFLIWHSLLVMEFEIALQSIDSTVTIPYWDWTIDQKLDDPSASEIFTSEYFGAANSSNLYVVDTGPLAYFPISSDPLEYVSWSSPYGYLRDFSNYNQAPYVSRMVGEAGSLGSTSDVDACLLMENFSSFWICIWGEYGTEAASSRIHAGVHYFVGGLYEDDDGKEWDGDMVDYYASPNDPMWFSHHAMIDRIWFQWKESVGSALVSKEDNCGGFYEGLTVDPQPVGHNLYEKFDPPFYAFRTIDEISTLGGLTLNEACDYFQNYRLPYVYDN